MWKVGAENPNARFKNKAKAFTGLGVVVAVVLNSNL